MKYLVRLGIVAVLIYTGLTYGRPWIEQLLADPNLGPLSGTTALDLRCVELAERVQIDFGEMVREHGQPPIDGDRWAGALKLIEGRWARARSACDCDGDACTSAREGLEQLSSLMGAFDDGVRGGTPPYNAANLMERIDEQLGKARRQLGR